MILIVGATGKLGRKVARILLPSGEEVRAMSRVVANTDELKALGARPIRADLRDREALDFAVRGARVVIASAHSILGRGEDSSEQVDDIGHRALIEAAKNAGVDHFIYTSVIGASVNHSLDFYRTKARIENYLRDSGLNYTIVRASAFMEMHAYELIGKPVLEGKRVMLFGKGTNPRNFVAAEDVAKVIVGSMKIPSLRGEAIDVGGPQNLTSMDVVHTFERMSGRKAKVGHIPIPVARVMGVAMKPAHPGIARVIRMGVLSETTDQTFDASVLRSRIPITLTSLEDWARDRIRH